MSHKITSIAAAAAFVAAAFASGAALADDITMDNNTQVTSSAPRAKVQSDLLKSADFPKFGSDEWSLQQNQVPQINSGFTPAQARADYLAHRDEVKALTAEDSGSSYLWKMQRSATSAMGAAPR
jgi:hypothetical protein